MKMKNLTVLLLTLVFTGCAAPREVLYDQTKRQPTTSVEIFREGNKPSQQFKEIGEIAYEDFGGEEPKVLKKHWCHWMSGKMGEQRVDGELEDGAGEVEKPGVRGGLFASEDRVAAR